jgi:DNA-binding FrmR family transcriptional regulator
VADTPGGLATLFGMAPSTNAPERGYTATKDQLLKRLRRVEGQVRGVQNMVDEDRYCIDVLTQISAVQAALDKVALGLMDDHARHCVVDGPEGLKEERTEELMAAVARLLRRG